LGSRLIGRWSPSRGGEVRFGTLRTSRFEVRFGTLRTLRFEVRVWDLEDLEDLEVRGQGVGSVT
jgi:hypothetical protein